MINRLAKRYAQVLYGLCEDAENIDTVSGELKQLNQLMLDLPDFARVLMSPFISVSKRHDVLKNILSEKFSSVTRDFIFLLERKKRLSFLGQICEAFEDLHREARGMAVIRIFSSRPLHPEQLTAICQGFQKKLNQTLIPQVCIDTKIIGGLKVQIGDQVYDYRLCTQLAHFKEQLIFS